jgi:magnesium-protoporphyrin O-methyltransferase
MSSTYIERRSKIETYFDRTAVAAWERLTSDKPVSGIRATVRAGRDRMRATLLSFLPDDLNGARVLDAGCGTGTLAVEVAMRGADVTAIDLSPTLIELAKERLPAISGNGRVHFVAGDMIDPAHGQFDYVIAMDSLIHYTMPDMLDMAARFTAISRKGILFTYAPWTPLLGTMQAVGKLFPRGDRSPWIVPHKKERLIETLLTDPRFSGFHPERSTQIASGFYHSTAQEVIRS